MVQFASYLRRVLSKTRLIFPRINGPTVHGCGRGRIKPLYRAASFSERNSYRSTADILLSPLNLLISTNKNEFKMREISDRRPRRLGQLLIAFLVANSFVIAGHTLSFSYDCGSLRKQPKIHNALLWFSLEMTSEKGAQKFHTDDALLPKSG